MVMVFWGLNQLSVAIFTILKVGSLIFGLMQQVANCKICYTHGENKIINFNQSYKLIGVEYILQVLAFIERVIRYYYL
jgi:hypothetical protein